MKYHVTVEAFGRIIAVNVEAASAEQAEQIVLDSDSVAFKISSRETGYALVDGERVEL